MWRTLTSYILVNSFESASWRTFKWVFQPVHRASRELKAQHFFRRRRNKFLKTGFHQKEVHTHTHIVNTFQRNMHMQSKECLGPRAAPRVGSRFSTVVFVHHWLLFVICRILECFRLPSGKSTVYQDHPRSWKIEFLLCQHSFDVHRPRLRTLTLLACGAGLLLLAAIGCHGVGTWTHWKPDSPPGPPQTGKYISKSISCMAGIGLMPCSRSTRRKILLVKLLERVGPWPVWMRLAGSHFESRLEGMLMPATWCPSKGSWFGKGSSIKSPKQTSQTNSK